MTRMHVKMIQLKSNHLRSDVALSLVVFLAFFTIVFGVDEFSISDTTPTNKATECDNSSIDRTGCILSASLTGHLEATEAVLSTMQELVVNARTKTKQIQNHVCAVLELKNGQLDINQKGRTTPANCNEIKKRHASSSSGIYKVWPTYLDHPINVYCDMETEDGGWTVFQRRNEYEGNQENFYRNWADYKNGFGNLSREFWLGNDAIFALSNEKDSILRIDLEDFSGNKRYATYFVFEVSTERNKYNITVSGYKGDAGDAMKLHDGHAFSTLESEDPNNCANLYKGGWWYAKCHHANLNGFYLKGNHSTFADGIEWHQWLGYNYSLKKTEMKMKPKN